MTTATVTLDDLFHLRRVMLELQKAGRHEELAALGRVHQAIEAIITADP